MKITFAEKDRPLAEKIQQVIKIKGGGGPKEGGGTIVHPKNSRYVNLLFQDLNSIQTIAILLNGNMRTPKIEALGRLIEWLNAKFKDRALGAEIVKLGLDSSPVP